MIWSIKNTIFFVLFCSPVVVGFAVLLAPNLIKTVVGAVIFIGTLYVANYTFFYSTPNADGPELMGLVLLNIVICATFLPCMFVKAVILFLIYLFGEKN